MTQRQERHRDRGTQRKRFFLCVPLLLLLLGCASVRPVIKIGLVAPFEGRDRAIGYDAVYAARLAVRQANAAGGIGGSDGRGGYRVALVALDDRGDAELATQTAAALVVDADVVAVVGHYLPPTTAAASNVYANAGLPLLPAGAPPSPPPTRTRCRPPSSPPMRASRPSTRRPAPTPGQPTTPSPSSGSP